MIITIKLSNIYIYRAKRHVRVRLKDLAPEEYVRSGVWHINLEIADGRILEHSLGNSLVLFSIDFSLGVSLIFVQQGKL